MANLVITSCSVWKREDGKQLKLFSRSERGNEKEKEFHFSGYNPFPCKRMISTFGIVENWLKANGWERVPGGFVSTREEFTDLTGEKYLSTKVVRFVPFSPAK